MKGLRNSSCSPVERNLFHLIIGSIFPILALSLTQDGITPAATNHEAQGVSAVLLWAAVGTTVLALVIEVTRFSLPSFNDLLFRYLGVFFKERERNRVTGATYLLIATLGAFLFFDRTVAAVALLYLSLGDPVAAFVGARFGRLKIFKKTVEGTSAFLIVALLAGAVFTMTGQIQPFWPLAVGGIVAAFLELLPLSLDDNLLTPLMAGAVITALL